MPPFFFILKLQILKNQHHYQTYFMGQTTRFRSTMLFNLLQNIVQNCQTFSEIVKVYCLKVT